MQEEVMYRCSNPSCARPMPRPVNFCPWCGSAQGQAGARAGADAYARDRAAAAAASATAAAAAQPAAQSGQVGQGGQARQGTAGAGAAAMASALHAATAHPEPAMPNPRSTATPSASDFGRSAAQGSAAPRQELPRQEVPRPAIPARPAQRKPVQLRWWILALLILWGVWLLAKPSTRKIERQIDQAVALAKECKGSEAQAELLALRSSRATPEQLERLQKALNEQSTVCTRRRLRNKAWSETSTAADAALDAGSVDKARTRLQSFIRRWGEDDKTRVLKARIDAAAERGQHPLAVPDQASFLRHSREGGNPGLLAFR